MLQELCNALLYGRTSAQGSIYVSAAFNRVQSHAALAICASRNKFKRYISVIDATYSRGENRTAKLGGNWLPQEVMFVLLQLLLSKTWRKATFSCFACFRLSNLWY